MLHDPSSGAGAETLRARFAERLGFTVPAARPGVEVLARRRRDGYEERHVRYRGVEGDVPAVLLVPDGPGPFPAVVGFHQHNSQRHLGKSEVAGLAGDPRQALGPSLARRGVAVLAPDAVGFEDRRRSGPGTEPRDGDGLAHFNELSYRLVRGQLLSATVLGDAAAAVSVLAALAEVDGGRVGAAGHSYGGNVTLMLAALDRRVAFACASGAACTYRARMAAGTGLELAHVVPGILEVGDLDDLTALVAPRSLLLVSATADPYSADAPEVARRAAGAWGGRGGLEHARYDGGHALTGERHARIVRWLAARARA